MGKLEKCDKWWRASLDISAADSKLVRKSIIKKTRAILRINYVCILPYIRHEMLRETQRISHLVRRSSYTHRSLSAISFPFGE